MSVIISVNTDDIIFSLLNEYNKYWEKQSIFGPKGNILFGTTFDIMKNILKYDKEQLDKYGSYYGTIMNGTFCFVTNDLDLLKAILIKNFDSFPDRFNFLKPPESDVRSKLITVTEGDDWKRIRCRITPAFTSGKLKKLVPVMQECSKELVKYLESFAVNTEEVLLKE